jgi:hypothetical protein
MGHDFIELNISRSRVIIRKRTEWGCQPASFHFFPEDPGALQTFHAGSCMIVTEMRRERGDVILPPSEI